MNINYALGQPRFNIRHVVTSRNRVDRYIVLTHKFLVAFSFVLFRWSMWYTRKRERGKNKGRGKKRQEKGCERKTMVRKERVERMRRMVSM